MKEAFKRKKFGQQALDQINVCNKIISAYQKQGFVLTLRQLYYRLVATDQFPADRKWTKVGEAKWVRDPQGTVNAEPNYKWLGGLLSDARLAGLVDWDAIEDRVRKPDTPPQWSSIASLVESALRAYRLPRWRDQENYIELWVEKDALAGVLRPVAERWHVTLMVNRGYSSTSAMYESAKRFLLACYEDYDGDDALVEGDTEYDGGDEDEFSFDEAEDDVDGRRDEDYDEALSAPRRRLLVKQPYLLYLGDHDPSGEDMVRDIGSRLKLFGVNDLKVRKLALTMKQVTEYAPPPNPTKMTDSRAAGYVDKFGGSSWEVDALPPEVLQQIINEAISELVDQSAMAAIVEQEESDKTQLRKAARNIVTVTRR